MNQYTTQYGTITIAEEGFRSIDHRRWAVRYDGFAATRTGEHSIGGIHTAHYGGPDYSRQYDGPYDSKCGWCWLGAGHTEAAHAERCPE